MAKIPASWLEAITPEPEHIKGCVICNRTAPVERSWFLAWRSTRGVTVIQALYVDLVVMANKRPPDDKLCGVDCAAKYASFVLNGEM